MFYIDFTSPEGKTYRIDVSKNPVIYECPVCGHITTYGFDPEDVNCCASCVEQRRIQEEKERKAKADAKLVDHINRVFKSNITIDDLKRLKLRLKRTREPLMNSSAHSKKTARNCKRRNGRMMWSWLYMSKKSLHRSEYVMSAIIRGNPKHYRLGFLFIIDDQFYGPYSSNSFLFIIFTVSYPRTITHFFKTDI